jgi:Protein of unknown function (DUF1552)
MTLEKSRRAVLRGAGGLVLGLPFLGSLARAQSTAPKRVAVLWQNNGINPNGFWPMAPFGALTDAHFQGQAGIAALKDFKSKLHVVRGLDFSPVGGHLGPLALTCYPAKDFSGLDQMAVAWAQGPSFDQIIAPKINPYRRSPLLLRVGTGFTGWIYSTLSYRAANMPVTHEKSPWLAYRDLIGLGPSMNQEAARLLVERRKSVLDLVSGRLDLIRNRKLSAADKSKLDLHFSAVRDLEMSLTAPTMQCMLPDARAKELEAFPATSFDIDAKFGQLTRMHLDVMALSFACDTNRVALLMIGAEAGGPVYSFDGLAHTYAHHPLSHGTQGEATDSGGVANYKDRLSEVDQWHGAQMKYFIEKLNAYTEGAGTVLDNTLVLWMNSMSSGAGHTSADTPIVMAGSLGGYFKTGLYSDVKDAAGTRKPHNMLITTLLNGLGEPETHFGSRAHGRAGNIPTLLA